MTKKPRTFISDLHWFKRCRKQLHEVIEDASPKGKEKAKKIVEFLDENPEVRRDLMSFYIKAKERLEQED